MTTPRNTRTIYLKDDDKVVWDEARLIAKRRDQSISSVVSVLLRDWVAANSATSPMPLPVGFRIPTSMKTPAAVKREELAADITALVLETLERREVS